MGNFRERRLRIVLEWSAALTGQRRSETSKKKPTAEQGESRRGRSPEPGSHVEKLEVTCGEQTFEIAFGKFGSWAFDRTVGSDEWRLSLQHLSRVQSTFEPSTFNSLLDQFRMIIGDCPEVTAGPLANSKFTRQITECLTLNQTQFRPSRPMRRHLMPRPIFRSIPPSFFLLTLAISPCARAQGTITTIAGDGHSLSSGIVAGDGGPAVQGHFDFPVAVARDAGGNLFIADSLNHRVRRVDASTGIITTVVGNPNARIPGDGGPATAARLDSPAGLAFDDDGNLYIADSGNNNIRMVSHGGDGMITGAANETITTVRILNGLTSTTAPWNGGADGLSHPTNLIALGSGSALTLLIADTGHNRVLSVTGIDTLEELITRLAGEPQPPTLITCQGQDLGDGGPPQDACLNGPTGLALDRAGNLFIADANDFEIRRVSQAQLSGQLIGTITTVAGGPLAGFSGDGGPATAALLGFNFQGFLPNRIGALSFDGSGNLYIVDKYNLRIRRIVPGADGLITGATDEIITTVAGNGASTGAVDGEGGNPVDDLGDGGPATTATFGFVPEGVTADSSGNLYIADTANFRVRKVISTPADTTPPAINNVPTDIVVEATGPEGATASYANPTATDLVDGAVPVTCAPASGSMFPLGTSTVSCSATDTHGNTAEASFNVKVRDTIPPKITCGGADGLWHAVDVGIACSVTDSGSGLSNPSDASFSLATGVAAGAETANATTGTRVVCDVAGNCATAGPIVGNKVDKKGPSLTLATPTNGAMYVLNQAMLAKFSCEDGGSGLATCSGTVANGANLNTSSAGSKSFTVTATDAVGNLTKVTNTYTVAYANSGTCYGDAGHQVLQPVNADGSSVFRQGSTVPAKFRVCDANGKSIGTSGLVVGFQLIQTVSGTLVSTVNEAVISTTPDTSFRWDATAQQWIFNVSTKSLSANVTYYYRITLDDGSTIDFRFGLK